MAEVLNIVLVAPQIPQNTGNIGRLCVNSGTRLHLIRPLGFSLDASQLRRAGLDYWTELDLQVHDSWHQFLEACRPQQMIFASTRGHRSVFDVSYKNGDYLVFGNETSGLPDEVYSQYQQSLCRIPMPGKGSRSLNLANSVAIVLFEALRQVKGW